MKVLNFGSLNIDNVYHVDHMVQGGETLTTEGKDIFPGGKGLNQSIALARAGVPVYHAGCIGEDGEFLQDVCRENHVDTTYIQTVQETTGHTVIQVDKHAQNSILLYAGSNGCITKAYVDSVLTHFTDEDILLLQNEINQIPYLIDYAYERGMKIYMNPSPISETLKQCDLHKVSVFLMNEIEGEAIAGSQEPKQILSYMRQQYPNASTVLTLGKKGAYYADGTEVYYQPAITVDAVDTTAAGDTFTGYFVAGMINGYPIQKTLAYAAEAAALAVTQKGAVPSIPYAENVEKFHIALESAK